MLLLGSRFKTPLLYIEEEELIHVAPNKRYFYGSTNQQKMEDIYVVEILYKGKSIFLSCSFISKRSTRDTNTLSEKVLFEEHLRTAGDQLC